jgi:peptidoglycan/LPS O-acetylase OafA/YrhL
MLFGTLCRKVVDAEKKSKLLLAVVILYAASWVLAKPMWMLSLLKSGRISFEDFMSVVPDAMAVTTFCLGISVLRLESRFFAWLGERSYSIYLFHPVVFYSFYLVVINVGELGLYKLHLGLYVVIAAVLTILLSSLTYRFIEKPAIELARRINNRWGSKPSVQAYTKASV